MNKYRTHNLSELTEKEIGKDVILSGWFTEKGIMETFFYRFT